MNLFVVPVASLLRAPGTTTRVRFAEVFDPDAVYGRLEAILAVAAR